MEFGGLSLLEIASKHETPSGKKEENSLTEAPVLVDKSDAEPNGSTGPSEESRGSADNEPNPAEEALKEASLAAQHAASKAAAAVSQLGGKLSTWWTSLDTPPSAAPREADHRTVEPAPRAAHEVDLRSTFGPGADENLIEALTCTLVQNYRCAHNSYTPDVEQSYRGTLYITEKHTCFLSTEPGDKVSFTLAHALVTSVLRQSPSSGRKSATLRLTQSSDRWIALTDFASDDELESAFALLEHKTDETG